MFYKYIAVAFLMGASSVSATEMSERKIKFSFDFGEMTLSNQGHTENTSGSSVPFNSETAKPLNPKAIRFFGSTKISDTISLQFGLGKKANTNYTNFSNSGSIERGSIRVTTETVDKESVWFEIAAQKQFNNRLYLRGGMALAEQQHSTSVTNSSSRFDDNGELEGPTILGGASTSTQYMQFTPVLGIGYALETVPLSFGIDLYPSFYKDLDIRFTDFEAEKEGNVAYFYTRWEH